MKRFASALLLLFTVIVSDIAYTASPSGKKFSILHTNDLHSRLAPFPVAGSPELMGGWARIASVIAAAKKEIPGNLLVLDAGDFLMGTLFHTVSREESVELSLLADMGYDAVTLGNHEFDLRPSDLVNIINAAEKKGKLPPLVAANLRFSDTDKADDSLKAVFDRGSIKPYIILKRDGVSFGIFGIMGKDSAEVAPFADPVTFDDPIATAQKTVDAMKSKERPDVIICLSHSGLNPDPKLSEDENLARKVKGIDIIISGHTHTRLQKPIVINDTIIVQSWAYGLTMGRLDFTVSQGKVTLDKYTEITIDKKIPVHAGIAAKIDEAKEKINASFLKSAGLTYNRPMIRPTFDLVIKEEESTVGNLITDAMLSYANTVLARSGTGEKADIAVMSNGLIRDNITKRGDDPVTVADLFNILPLGIGIDDSLGYPMVILYVTAAEIKKSLEIITSIYPLKGSDYFLQLSGLRFTYNPNRMIFDRVTGIEIGNDDRGFQPLDYSDANTKLYSVVSDIYNATFLKIIGSFTWNILTIVPKDRNGKPIAELKNARIDYDPAKPGIQETKEWLSLIHFAQGLTLAKGETLPAIPDYYRSPKNRIVKIPSWNPANLAAKGTAVTRAAVIAVTGLITVLLSLIALAVRKKLAAR